MQSNNTIDVHAGYFQIQDHLTLDYRPTGAPGAQFTDESSPLFGLLGELHLLEHDAQPLLRQIGERDRTIAAYLKILSKRIELIGRALALQMTDDMGPTVPVTLSEAGLTFSSEAPLPIGSWLALRLLLPSPTGLSAPVQVVDCRPASSSGEYLIQVSFEQFTEAQRQLLARHIVHKQAQDIRAAKDNERTSP